MSRESLYQIIDEEQWSIGDEITLSKELIRVIEKDIDGEKTKNTHKGGFAQKLRKRRTGAQPSRLQWAQKRE